MRLKRKTSLYMDIKKTPEANLENKKVTYLLIGLVVALSVLFVCFEWTEKDITVYKSEDTTALDFETEQVIQTVQEETPPPKPPEVPDVIEEIKVVDNETETEEVDFSSEDDSKTVQEIIQAPVEAPPVEDEDLDKVFVVVEQMPEPPGGMAGLMKYFSSHVRYPVEAAENNIQGRVICQFTVFKDGHIGDIVVVVKVDPSLDKEAVRLISNMPKWKPGRQQGKAVNCKYTVPVYFKLQS